MGFWKWLLKRAKQIMPHPAKEDIILGSGIISILSGIIGTFLVLGTNLPLIAALITVPLIPIGFLLFCYSWYIVEVKGGSKDE